MHNEKMLNILYILGDRGHDLTVNHGYRIHVLKILEHLEKKRHQPFLIHINDKEYLPDFKNYLCIPHRYMPVIHRFLPYTGFLDSLRILIQIIRLNRRMHFDVIHERYGLYSYGGILAAKLLKKPLLLEVNAPLVEEKQLFTEPLTSYQKLSATTSTKVCFKFSDRIVAVSNVLKEILVNNWHTAREKIRVIPNAFDSSLFNKQYDTVPIKTKLGLLNAFVITFVGTFQSWYGIENLVEAFCFIVKKTPHAKLLLVGDGSLKEDLKIQVEKLGISKSVIFTGYINHNLIPQILAITDITVAPFRHLPTGFYGSAIKIFEYMAAGKPIIASKIGQIGEILEHEKTGLLIEPGNIQGLVDSIMRLYKEPNLMKRLGTNAKVEAGKYTWDAYADKLIEIYTELITQNA